MTVHRNKKLYYLLAVLTACLYTPVYAKTGSGANFLKFGTGARPIGMAGAFTAISDDINALYWNPAGISMINSSELNLMHNEAGENIRHEYAAFAKQEPRLRGAVGTSISYFSVRDIQGYDSNGVKTSLLDSSSLAVGLSYSFLPYQDTSLGATLKFIDEKLHNKSATAYAFDLGILWKTPVQGLQFGAVLKNAGTGLKFISEKSPLPMTFNMGLSQSFDILGYSTIISAETVFPSDYKSHFLFGLESTAYRILSIRAGYNTSDDLDSGIRLGGGISGKNLSIDYAWTPRGTFEESHRISLTIKIGTIHEEAVIDNSITKHVKQGERYYNTGRILDAYKEFKYVLMAAPRNKTAQEYISRIEVAAESSAVKKEIETAYKKGLRYLNNGDLTSARAEFELILSIDENNEKADTSIETINSRFQEVSDSLTAKGKILFEKGDYISSMKEFEKSFSIDPSNDIAREYFAKAKKRSEALEKKRKQVKEAQKKKIKERKTKRLLDSAKGYLAINEWEDAVTTLDKTLKIDPDNSEALELISHALEKQADIFLKNNDLLEAKELYSSSIEYNKNNTDSKKQLDKIIPKMIELAKDLNRQGLVAYSKGDIKSAIDLLQKAMLYDPELKQAQENLKRAKKEIAQ
ncbi:PorV/PorQ family protein [Elusimicrobiota bacterium]